MSGNLVVSVYASSLRLAALRPVWGRPVLLAELVADIFAPC